MQLNGFAFIMSKKSYFAQIEYTKRNQSELLISGSISSHVCKHTCHFQQSVSQCAFSMVNMCNDAKIPDSIHRKLGQVNDFLRDTIRQNLVNTTFQTLNRKQDVLFHRRFYLVTLCAEIRELQLEIIRKNRQPLHTATF